MPTRTARTIWSGEPSDGGGTVQFVTSSSPAVDFSRAGRVGARAAGSATPEELLAGAHSSCLAMELAALLHDAGATVHGLDVTADVTLSADESGRHSVRDVLLEVSGDVIGIEPAAFVDLAQEAGRTCPMSRALSDVAVRVDASV